MPEQSLDGRRIAITGAGRGLGRSLAIVAADHGADLVLLGRDPSALKNVAAVIEARCQRESLVVPLDLADANSVVNACAVVLEKDPKLDVLVNNGAPWLVGDLDEISDAEIASTVAAAVTGTILVTKGLLPALRQSEAADIVTIISTSGVLGWDISGASVPFYAAKHGQSGFTDKLRDELKDENIRVSAIYPPDFEDIDPTDARWSTPPDRGSRMSNREVVSTVLFLIAAPRSCSFPVVIMSNTV